MKAEESREEILYYFKKHGNCDLPYCIEVASETEGEQVMVVGGTHGNEPAGVRAMLARYHLLDTAADASKRKIPVIEQYESIGAIRPGPHFKFLIKDVATGTRLEKGQAFARDDNGDRIALQDCYIVAPSRVVKSTDDDAGFLCRLNQIRFSSTP